MENNLPNLRELFISDPTTGSIRFTAKGVEYFRTRFAKAGIDIREIRTINEFQAAYDKVWNGEMSLAAMNEKDPAIDKALADIPAYRDGMSLRD